MTHDDSFWYGMSDLEATHSIVVDRPRGSRHPRYPETIFPFDYGFLEGTKSADGDGIDVWLGSVNPTDHALTGILSTFDTLKRDAEIKLLIGCPDEDVQIIRDFYRDMYTLYISNPRPGTT